MSDIRSAQELLAAAQRGGPGADPAPLKTRERIHLEKFDHEAGPEPVLVEYIIADAKTGRIIYRGATPPPNEEG